MQLPCSSLLLNANPPRRDLHRWCACHAKLSSANHPLLESPGETRGLRKNVHNFIKVHFRLLTANPKAEALYLITETAKKKENIIQNISRPHGYVLSFMSLLTHLICPFKHQWKSSKRIKLKVNHGCKLRELKSAKSEKRFQTPPAMASLPVCSEREGPVSE